MFLKVNEIIIQTNDSCCQKYFLKTCLANNIPILFVGPTGTGKSAIVLDHLVNLPKEKFLPNIVNFSARTSSNMVILFIYSILYYVTITIKYTIHFLDARNCHV